MLDIVPTLKAELAANEADVAKMSAEVDRLQGRLRLSAEKAAKLREIIALYVGAEGGAAEIAAQEPLFYAPKHTMLTISTDQPASLTSRTKAAMIKAAVINLLDHQGTAHRQEILDVLVQLGLMGSEKNPMGSLAAYLSDYRDTFTADGRGNFSLKPAVGKAMRESISSARKALDILEDHPTLHVG